MPQRLGVIADTHYPTRVPYLPYDDIARAFDGVAQIVHLGDIETPEVLEALSRIAPVVAVRGDDDQFHPPLRRVLTVNGVRIGLTHGQRSLYVERLRPRLMRLVGRPVDAWNGMHDDLLRWFASEEVRAILFGHWHRPCHLTRDGVLLFSPGAVYVMTLEAIRWQLGQPQGRLRARFLRHHLRRAQRHPEQYQGTSTVGVLTVEDDGTLYAEVIPLPALRYPP